MVMISLVHFFGGDNSCISDDHSPKENDDYHSFEWHCNHLIQYDGNGHPFALNVNRSPKGNMWSAIPVALL